MLARPDPSTFQVLPWRGEAPGTARMFCDILTPDGAPSYADPRHGLRRVMQKAAELGFTFYVHPEVEFFLLREKPTPELPLPDPIDAGGYFDQTPHDLGHDFRRTAITMLERMGISVEFSHHEVAPGQQEIDLRYADALTTADNLMTMRLVVKEVALEQGIYASFMPKPFTDQPGSAMHTHLSLFEGDRNAFHDASDRYQLSKVGKAFVAGLLRHAAEFTAARRRRTSAGGTTTARRWCACRCTSRTRATRRGWRSVRPTRRATPTSPSRCSSPPASRASRRGTSCPTVRRTTCGR
jgi:glutamine synthetase